jgi:hypothetical protein
MRIRIAGAAALVALALAAGPASAQAGPLRAGVGKADVTPRTGYVLGGWTRGDRHGQGVHTRLFSRALVLERDGRKVALVQLDLFMTPGGMVKQIGEALAARGFSEQNILISATHTHSGPGGYANFNTLNTTAPSLETATDPSSFFGLLAPGPAEPQLYAFLSKQIAAAIRRADDDLAPAAAAWGSERLLGLTRNRSLEAHLANFGIQEAYGRGRAEQAPGGYAETIDPEVSVLRVDKLVRRRGRKTRRVPIGAWTNFANHGTVTQSSFQYYNGDHFASAMQVFEARVRKAGKVPRRQEVLNVFANGDEGDQSAGLDHHGPAYSDYVGRVEAAAMLRAWSRAGRRLTTKPRIDLRWTRVCFCGQEVNGQPIGTESRVGLPFLTGSEEGRGPLFDVTHQHFEGSRLPANLDPVHGDKLGLPGLGAGVPAKVPLAAVRIGSGMIVTVPGEPTKAVGTLAKQAVATNLGGSGISRVIVAGLTNEFALYFTTPAEYDQQHYEGGNSQFGRQAGAFIAASLGELGGTLARGTPAPPPAPFDPTNGTRPTGAAYGDGAARGAIAVQPGSGYGRLERARLSWSGGAAGLDRPVDRAFVTAQRLRRGRWVAVDSDLGLAMLWSVNAAGRYDLRWEIPRDAPRGTYRFVVTAKRYRLESRHFRIHGSGGLRVVPVGASDGRAAVSLEYPPAETDVDLTHRPLYASGGVVVFRVGGRTVRVARKSGTVFSVPAPEGTPVSVAPRAARDRFHNVNGPSAQIR